MLAVLSAWRSWSAAVSVSRFTASAVLTWSTRCTPPCRSRPRRTRVHGGQNAATASPVTTRIVRNFHRRFLYIYEPLAGPRRHYITLYRSFAKNRGTLSALTVSNSFAVTPSRDRVACVLRCAGLTGVAVLCFVAALRGSGPSTADLLARYIQHPDEVAAELGSVVDLDGARSDLDRLAPKFLAGLPAKVDSVISSVPPAGPAVSIPEQRRRDLVAFALDLAGANVARSE